MGSKTTTPFFDMCMTKILDAMRLLRKGMEMVHDDHIRIRASPVRYITMIHRAGVTSTCSVDTQAASVTEEIHSVQ